jgi:GT2 family glycosyltransferase
MNDVTVSIVSHGQDSLLATSLKDLAVHCPNTKSVVITHNLALHAPFQPPAQLDSLVLHNRQPKGFGANHNAGFKHCTTPFFCVVNPDVRLTADPFPALLACMDDTQVGIVAPMVVTPQGDYDGNARCFPTPLRLLNKLVRGDDARYEGFPDGPTPVAWAAGMFMMFRSEAFEALGGFDEGFHLYYEDVDICTRLWKAGWKVLLHPGAHVVHDAQRTSHRNFRYMRWHVASMARYFRKHMWRLPETGVKA